jgi:hypothetical protein
MTEFTGAGEEPIRIGLATSNAAELLQTIKHVRNSMVGRRRPLLQPEPAILLPADLPTLSARIRRLPVAAQRRGFDPRVDELRSHGSLLSFFE